ncbi:hypothetical protein [Scale drop disease virus]|uniref:ORF_054R n=1 Tax=Scale drop disease virus TaxID=1697349 RepID=A0A0K1L6H2_9VIRU|nr:ORF_054R [Scale drop disease virus]AKU37469.1 ORF_054R [Scale drop disease virus]QLI60724.1 hypothetical protein [Scale drop disease virus]QXJ13642.1 ORF054R [Scale drop disease virus]UNH60732.1 hypothetical protein SDDV_ORF063 [Scale drop disease virus]
MAFYYPQKIQYKITVDKLSTLSCYYPITVNVDSIYDNYTISVYKTHFANYPETFTVTGTIDVKDRTKCTYYCTDHTKKSNKLLVDYIYKKLTTPMLNADYITVEFRGVVDDENDILFKRVYVGHSNFNFETCDFLLLKQAFSTQLVHSGPFHIWGTICVDDKTESKYGSVVCPGLGIHYCKNTIIDRAVLEIAILNFVGNNLLLQQKQAKRLLRV